MDQAIGPGSKFWHCPTEGTHHEGKFYWASMPH